MSKHGLCCIHNGLQEQGHRFQTMTWKGFSSSPREESIAKLTSRYQNNLDVIFRIISECVVNEWCYRVSSDILPLMTHPESGLVWEQLPNFDTLNALFERCAVKAKLYDLRLSCHPDQFNVLASENAKAVDSTIRELNHHGWFMSKLGTPLSPESPINIHINGSKGDPKEIAKRFKDGLDRLDEAARSRLVVETEDKGIWNARNLVEHIHSLTGIPVTFDYLHHRCNDGGLTEKEAFELCVQTWGDNKPLFHFCESLPGQKNPRKHADYPTYLPDTYGYDVDLDFEFKAKDFALKKAQEIGNVLDGSKVVV